MTQYRTSSIYHRYVPHLLIFVPLQSQTSLWIYETVKLASPEPLTCSLPVFHILRSDYMLYIIRYVYILTVVS